MGLLIGILGDGRGTYVKRVSGSVRALGGARFPPGLHQQYGEEGAMGSGICVTSFQDSPHRLREVVVRNPKAYIQNATLTP